MDNTKKKNVVDVSCFFIFEATGDSEADQFVDPYKVTSTTIDRHGEDDVDDAESCSHDDDDDEELSDDHFQFVIKNNSSRNNRVNGSFFDNVRVRILDDKVEEGEEAHSYYPTWPHDPHNNNNNNNGRKNSIVDSSHEEKFLSEMEKNKLFWETCLAS